MILDSSRQFIALSYSIEKEVEIIISIQNNILLNKTLSVVGCGASVNTKFALNLNYSYFVLTSSEPVPDVSEADLLKYMINTEFLKTVTSYCLLKHKEYFIEIWDVCVFSEYRGIMLSDKVNHKVSNFLLQSIIKRANLSLWLIVKPDNQKAANLYIKHGFVVKGVIESDSTGDIPMPASIYMTRQINSSEINILHNQKLFKRASNMILGYANKSTLNIRIDSKVIDVMNILIADNYVEFGGYLLPINNNAVGYLHLGLHKAIIKGSAFAVAFAHIEYNFTFHIHRHNVTQKPSSGDILGAVINVIDLINKDLFYKPLIHFLFCTNSVYTINVTPEMSEFIFRFLNFGEKSSEIELRDKLMIALRIVTGPTSEDWQNKTDEDLIQILENLNLDPNILPSGAASTIRFVNLKRYFKNMITHLSSIYHTGIGDWNDQEMTEDKARILCEYINSISLVTLMMMTPTEDLINQEMTTYFGGNTEIRLLKIGFYKTQKGKDVDITFNDISSSKVLSDLVFDNENLVDFSKLIIKDIPEMIQRMPVQEIYYHNYSLKKLEANPNTFNLQ